MTKKFKSQPAQNPSVSEQLNQPAPVLRLPRDLQGKRSQLTHLMPRLSSPCLKQALQTMLADDVHVQHYSQWFKSTQDEDRQLRQRHGMRMTRSEMAALAVGEVMYLLDNQYDPIGNAELRTAVQQLTVLGTWLWQQARDEFRDEVDAIAEEAAAGTQPSVSLRHRDEFDQTDPFEDDHITKVIGADGEAVKVGWGAELYTARTETQGELPRQRLMSPRWPTPGTFKPTTPKTSLLLVMLRKLSVQEPLYARVLALAWSIPLAWVELQDVVVSVKRERVLLSHVLCWSRAANLRVQNRHVRGGHRVAQGRGARTGVHNTRLHHKQPGQSD